VERAGEDAVRSRDDFDQVPTGNLDRGDFVGRETDEVGELRTRE
jgi:hypothetical protein